MNGSTCRKPPDWFAPAGRVFRGKPGRGLPNRRQKLMLLFIHKTLPSTEPRLVTPALALNHHVQSSTDGIYKEPYRGGGLKAAPLGKESICDFDTRDNSFRILSQASDGGLSALCPLPWGSSPS